MFLELVTLATLVVKFENKLPCLPTMVNSKPNIIKNGLQKSFLTCQNHLKTLCEVTFEREDILRWFQVLCKHLTEIISLIGAYYKDGTESQLPGTQNTILLYLTQILTSLSLLINIFVREEEIKLIITEARKSFVRQITCCLESIEVALNYGKTLNDPSGNFVKWMDAALAKVAEININDGRSKTVVIYVETRQIFEEVLSHAMSIAQVSLPEDSKIIRGSCQSVLSTLSSLEKEINRSVVNGAMVNLFIDACSDALCLLEKKVNTAVLKLCVETFSQFTSPLERIQNFCFDSSNKEVIEELDGLVVDFDLHVDRIMQIGLFAVSCSSDLARGIKIRSCLASLEALESELVPALTAVLLENSDHHTNCATTLMKHWLDQASCLQQLIYLIIDPFAFCQVIYEEAADIVDNLSNSVRKKGSIKQSDVHRFVLTIKVLQSFLEKAQTEFSINEKDKVKTKLKDYNEVLEEVEKASQLLLTDEINEVESCKRVLKRCKILLTVLKRLWLCFANDIAPNKNISIVTESKGADLPSRVENLQMEPTGNPFLDHIINRGKQILQDRSVLYRTPIKNISVAAKATSGSTFTKNPRKEVPLSRLVHLRKLCFTNTKNKDEGSLDLQITDILNEMTSLSTSFKPHRNHGRVQVSSDTSLGKINNF